MIRIATTQLWVHDQDEALRFYTEQVGMEVRQDVTMPEMGDFRWLTVAPAGQDVDIVLMAIPPAPIMDPSTADQVRGLMGKGFAGTVFLTTDDCLGGGARAEGAWCHVHGGAGGAAVWPGCFLPRPVRQQHPAGPAARGRPQLAGAASSRHHRPARTTTDRTPRRSSCVP